MKCADRRKEEKVETNTANESCQNGGFRSPGCGDEKNDEQEGQRNCGRIDVTAEDFENGGRGGNDNDGYDVSEDLFTILRVSQLSIDSSADVNNWTALRILFRLAQNFMSHRRSIAFTEGDVLQQDTTKGFLRSSQNKREAVYPFHPAGTAETRR